MGEKGNLADIGGPDPTEQAVAQNLTSTQQLMSGMQHSAQNIANSPGTPSGADSVTKVTGAIAPIVGDDDKGQAGGP
jgi:hypothetical protein